MAVALLKTKPKNSITEMSVAIGTVAMLLMLVLPMPRWLLDIVLAMNITLALGILMVTFYVRRPLEFSSFPSMLLLVTLLRLALNVSATRLILSEADAGAVIAAFGSFVIGGNFVVGIVVFIVLVVIQFVVITSGAGRVAEVAARFTLDAMPGKQMAIDAELNAGAIDEQTARQRRHEVAREADFYGAMDGASKFIRGDAIAAVVMIIINILGGFAVGVLQRRMDLGGAFQTYTLLTVGEGLVTQMPALLISAASGLLVTRTASDTSLGSELSSQLVAHHQPILVTSGALAALAFAPGLPAVPFLGIGIALAVYGYGLRQKQLAPAPPPPALPKPVEDMTALLAVDPISVELGYALVCLADPKQGGDLLERVTSARRQIATDLGFLVPPIRVHDNVRLKGNQYAIKIRGQEIGSGDLLPGQLLALEGGAVTQSIGGAQMKDPAFGLPAVWVPSNQRSIAEVSGYTVVDPPNVLVTHLTELIRRNASEMLTRQEVQALIDNVKKSSPAVIEELIPNVLTLGQIQKILQLLLRERVSIRDLTSILEAAADAALGTKDPEVIVEHVRQRLARQLTKQHVEADNRLYCFTLHPSVEQTLAENIKRMDNGLQLAMETSAQQLLLSAIKEWAERMVSAGHQAILLCTPRVRMAVRQLTDQAVPTLFVLSFYEVAPGVTVESLGIVNWTNANTTI